VKRELFGSRRERFVAGLGGDRAAVGRTHPAAGDGIVGAGDRRDAVSDTLPRTGPDPQFLPLRPVR
jgi:hypothetical protein